MLQRKSKGGKSFVFVCTSVESKRFQTSLAKSIAKLPIVAASIPERAPCSYRCPVYKNKAGQWRISKTAVLQHVQMCPSKAKATMRELISDPTFIDLVGENKARFRRVECGRVCGRAQ